MRLRFLIVLSILALCFTALTPHPVHAVGNIVVNTALDVGPDHQDGLCSLRVAIISATGNSNSSDDDCATGVSDDLDVIHIAPSLAGQTLTITTPLPQIYSTISTDTLEIIGPTDQSSGFTINGNNQTRIFELGLSTVPGNLTLSNITVRGGNANGTAGWTTPGDGGAIYVSGTNSRLTLNNVVLRNNTAPGTPGVDGGRGGAIFVNEAATITSNGGAFISNSATGSGNGVGKGAGLGGAIYIFDGPVTFNGYAITFDGNSAASQGGVIFANYNNANSAITLERSTLKGNTAKFGGAFFLQAGAGAVTVTDSTFSGNSVSGNGGVFGSSTAAGVGTFTRSTFYNNTAALGGFMSGGNVTLRNSILYNSTCNLSSASITGGSNLSGGDVSGCSNANFIGTITGFDTTLRNNGGALETHALLPGSNAIDAASQAYCPAGSIDQRSIVRGVNGAGAVNSPQPGDCDIGAYEFVQAVLNFADTNTITMSENDTQANGAGRKIRVRLTLPNPAQTTLAAPLDVTLTPRPYQASCSDDSCSTAQINKDFTFANQTITVPTGTANGTIIEFTIYALQDRIAELAGEFAVFDLTAAGASTAEPRTQRVSISDDDVAGINFTQSGGSTVVDEAFPAVTDSIQFVLNSQPNFNADVVVTVTPDRDCTVNNKPAGSADTFTVENEDWESLSNVVTIHVVDDLYDEDFRDETVAHQCQVRFNFTTTGGDDRTGDGVGDGDPVYNNTTNNFFVTIYDNDVAGVTITETAGSTTLVEGGATDTYTVVLNTPPDPGKPLPSTPRGPTIVVADPDAQCDLGAGAGQPINLSFNGSTWNIPQTVTVTAIDDMTVELEHTCVITHTIVSDDPVYANLDDAPPFAFTPRTINATIDDFIPFTLLNDPPNVTVNTNDGLSVSEATPNTADTFSVVLFRQPLTQNVTITLTASSDPRIPGTQVLLQDSNVSTPDAPAGTLTLTFTPANWNVPQTVQVFAFNDDYDEDETHTAAITATMDSDAAGFDTASSRKFIVNGVETLNTVDIPVSITDNDTSSVALDIGGGIILAEGGATDTFDFELGTHPYADVTVTVDPDEDCDVGSGSGTSRDFSVAHDDWNVPQTVTVTAVDDVLIEGTHTCSITVTAFSTGDTLYDNLAATVSPVTGTITDNDFPRVLITTSGGIALDEANVSTTDSYEVVLHSLPDADVTVNLTIADGQALLSSVAQPEPAASLPLTFTTLNWNVAQIVTVTVINDDIDEANPHFSSISHVVDSTATGYATAPEYYVDGVPNASVSITIADDDTAGVTVINGVNVAVTEGGIPYIYSLVLDSQPISDVIITITPTDECDLGAGPEIAITLTFTAFNWDTVQDVDVSAFDDQQVEGTHTCTITHVAASLDILYNNTPISDIPVTVTDNDEPRIALSTGDGISISEATPAVADTYSVVLLSEPLGNVDVNITVSDGQTQVSTGVGIPAGSLTLTFTPANWNVPQIVNVTPVDDLFDEADPHIGVINHAASSAAVGYATSTVFVRDGIEDESTVEASIADNDVPAVIVTETGGGTAVEEGGATDTFSIVLGAIPTAEVSVAVTPDSQCDVGAGAGTAITLVFNTSNSIIPQSVTVTAVNDDIAEGAHSCVITSTASSSGGNYDGLTGSDVTAAITDNDTAGVIVTQSGGVTNVFEGGASDSYDVVLQSEPIAAVTISITFGAQCTAAPTTLNFNATTWDIPQSVTVSAIDDGIIEPSPLPCSITNASTSTDNNYNSISILVIANVYDNDGADLVITQTNGNTEVSEAGTTSDTYDINLTIAPTANVTVTLITNGQCTVDMPSITFDTANWGITQTVIVTAVDDAVSEPTPHSCAITHSSSSTDTRYNLLRTLSVNVVDDDISGLIITETDGSTIVEEASPLTADTYSVALAADPGGTVTITISTNGECAVTPSLLTFDSSNWNIDQQVSVTAIDDTASEPSPHNCTITHTLSGAASGIVDINAFVVDNDSSALVVLPTGGNSQVAEQGATTDTVEVRLATATTSIVFVDITTNGQCLIIAPALPLTFGIADWNVTQTVTVQAVDDAIDEPTQHDCLLSFQSISTDANYTGLTAQHIVTVLDNEGEQSSSVGGSTQIIPVETFLCSNLTEQTNGAMNGSGGISNVELNGVRGDTYCSVLSLNGEFKRSPAEIGNASVIDQGVLQALDVFALLPGGVPVVPFQSPVQICFAGSGSVYFLSSLDINPAAAFLPPLASSPAGFVCVSVPNAGKVVLVRTPFSLPTYQSSPVTLTQGACQVTTTFSVRLRATPDASSSANVITTLPFNLTLVATGYISGWYRVIYLNGQGWVSEQYLSTRGDC